MKKKLLMLLIVIIVIFSIIAIISRKPNYSINDPLKNYNLQNTNNKNEYLDFLKESIQPKKLRVFIKNNYVPTSILDNNDTGEDMLNLMRFIGYEFLFKSMFNKNRTNFDDCPVTDNFKNKFNTNLIEYYNIKESEDCEVNCSLDMQNKTISVEVYGDFNPEDTEPTYYHTHHFHYTLDNEGNVNDVLFDYTE